MSEHSEAAAFSASVHSVRTVPSRKVVQVVLEAPIEQHALIATVAEHNTWLGIARLKIQPEPRRPEKKLWHELPPASQAAMRCQEVAFHQFLKVADADEAADEVRKRCEVQSRSELSTDTRASAAWEQLDISYQQWLRA